MHSSTVIKKIWVNNSLLAPRGDRTSTSSIRHHTAPRHESEPIEGNKFTGRYSWPGITRPFRLSHQPFLEVSERVSRVLMRDSLVSRDRGMVRLPTGSEND